MSAQNPTATFVLSIEATTGYEAQTEGTCTPEQYGAAMAALHGKPTPTEKELLAALNGLLTADVVALIKDDPAAFGTAWHAALAAVSKATGGAL